MAAATKTPVPWFGLEQIYEGPFEGAHMYDALYGPPSGGVDFEHHCWRDKQGALHGQLTGSRSVDTPIDKAQQRLAQVIALTRKATREDT